MEKKGITLTKQSIMLKISCSILFSYRISRKYFIIQNIFLKRYAREFNFNIFRISSSCKGDMKLTQIK